MNKPALGLLAETRVGSALAPVQDYLVELHERVSGLTGGKPADYIPELGKADPAAFGIALATVDGEVYAVGDSNRPSPSNRCRSPSCTATRSSATAARPC